MKLVVGINIRETSQKLKYLIYNNSKSENKNLLLYNTRKISQQKKAN